MPYIQSSSKRHLVSSVIAAFERHIVPDASRFRGACCRETSTTRTSSSGRTGRWRASSTSGTPSTGKRTDGDEQATRRTRIFNGRQTPIVLLCDWTFEGTNDERLTNVGGGTASRPVPRSSFRIARTKHGSKAPRTSRYVGPVHSLAIPDLNTTAFVHYCF